MYHSILLGKGVLKLSKLLNLGSGSTWPGHAALKADSKIIRKVIAKNPGLKVVLIAGTNGKTTTTKALSHVLEYAGTSTLSNSAGANLLNGLASLMVKHIRLDGTLKHKALIFEVDENSLPLVLEEIPKPDGIILLNLFRDQLDRYGEINTTAEKWKKSFEKLENQTLVVANSDDPLVAYSASFSKNKTYFTIEDKFKKSTVLSHAVDSTTCPKCNNPLIYSGISYSHLGNYTCSNCEFKKPIALSFSLKTSLLGNYNIYNLTAAVLVANKIFGIEIKDTLSAVQTFKPAFGRQEIIDVDGKNVMLLLSKNPTGFNESLKVALENKNSTLLLLLNDRIPDGRDISWIWDVDFEILADLKLNIFVSGDRAYDMANRLLFAGVSNVVFENFKEAYFESLKETQTGKTLTILPTYSAMLEVRKLIGGRSIL